MNEHATKETTMEIRLVLISDYCNLEDDYLFIYDTARSEMVKIPLLLLKRIEVSKK